MRTHHLVALIALIALCSCASRDSVSSLEATFPTMSAVVTGGASFALSDGVYAAERPSPTDPVRAVEVALEQRAVPQPRLPMSGEHPFEVRMPSGAIISVREHGLAGPARRVGAAIAYSRPGVTSYFSRTEAGFEEWLDVENATETPVAEWTIDGAALEPDADGVKLLGPHGAIGKVVAPFAVEAGGRRVRAWLVATGQRLSLYTDARGRALVDPAWVTTSAMTSRFQHSATLLPNGRVLVVGGRSSTGAAPPVSTVELYTPSTGAWTTTAPMATARYLHTATLLRSGRVLVIGGDSSGTVVPSPSASAEIFTPTNSGGLWQAVVMPLAVARYRHTATLLDDGRVLITGGTDGSDQPTATAELFTENVTSPTLSTIALAASMAAPRSWHTATRVADGRVLVVGGNGVGTTDGELYNPMTNLWVTAANGADGGLVDPRSSHSATLLPNGRVLIAGGTSRSGGTAVITSALFDPVTARFSTGPAMPDARRSHAAALLPNETVALFGGTGPCAPCSYPTTTLIFTPDGGSGSWATDLTSTTARSFPTATVLPTGRVLLVGGTNSMGLVAGAQLYSPSTPSSLPSQPPLQAARGRHTVTVLHTGRVLVTGGAGGFGALNTAELYEPSTGAWSLTGAMSVSRASHTATLLNDGRVLVVGGRSGPALTYLDSAELYSPTSQTWSSAASVGNAIAEHAAVLLSDGRVLVTGGRNGAANWDLSMAYNPATNQWASTGTGPGARSAHTLTLLPTGHVLMVGGQQPLGTGVSTSQRFDPASGLWTTATPLALPRFLHTATLLPSGRVLVTGGTPNGSAPVANAELFDPTTSAWSTMASPPTPRHSHAATLIHDGRVAMLGGHAGLASEAVEVFDPTADGGVWSSLPSLNGGRSNLAAVALPHGDLLVLGGNGMATAVDFVDRLTFSPLAGPLTRPTLDGPMPPLRPNTSFTLTGARFRGVGEGSTGGTQSSPTEMPFLQLDTLTTQTRTFVPLSSWSATSLTVDGGVPAGLYWARVVVNGAPSDPRFLPVFPPLTLSPLTPTVPPRGSVAFTGSGAAGSGYLWLVNTSTGATMDGGLYTAGPTGGANDTVFLASEFNTPISTQVTVGPGVSIAGPSSIPPRGSLTLSASGGSNAGFMWAFVTNASAATAAGPTYLAGNIGSVTDVVRATDSLGNTTTKSITVTEGVSIAPASVSVPPRGVQVFSADGGSRAGFTWALTTNNSGATFDAFMARYTAGTTPNVTDTVQVTDSLGNSASRTISVGGALSIAPATATVVPRAQLGLVAVNGLGPFSWSFVGASASGGSIHGTSGLYTAGPTGNVTDMVQVTDTLGNMATATITVGRGVSISPPSATAPPRGSVSFSASGGSDAGFVWSLATNPSGATSVAAGAYVAGANGNVSDVVRVADDLGNFATATVTVTAGVSVAPASATVTPRGAQAFTASGGSGTGFTYAVVANNSDGGVHPTSGAYVAGSLGNVTDTLRATDSLGNTRDVLITVTAGVGIAPASASTPPLGTVNFSASGGVGGPYTWSMVATNSGAASISPSGQYQAGAVEAVDTIRAVDALGNVATATITVTNALAITPPAVTLAPRASQAFTATGGSGMGYVWSLPVNASGASFDAGTAHYVAGSTGNTSDTVRVVDSLGAVANATITIGPGVSVTPATAAVTPRGTRSFVASGGSGAGFTWSLSTNASGGTIDGATGSYTAGSTGSVTDVITATDSLGNTGTASVMVGAGLSVMPSAPSVPPRGGLTFSASGGTGIGFAWTFADRRSGNTASVDALGQYQAGTMGGVVDVLRVTDSAGNVGLVSVTVTGGVAIAPSAPRAVPLGVIDFTASGGADGGYAWSLRTNASQGSLDAVTGRYVAGAIGNTTDVVEATDTLGNSASVNVLVSGSVALAPAVVSQAPRSSRTFTVTGGSPPFSWALSSNGSGGAVSSGGVYTAGATPSVTDIVVVTDSVGSTASATVNVTAGVSLTPAVLTLAARATQTFVAAGGSGAGFTWALTTNGSGGAIDEAGAYSAGDSAGVDVVQVTDSLGNVATATVTVTQATGPDTTTPFSQRPAFSGWSCGCQGAPLDASVLFGALALLARRRRAPSRRASRRFGRWLGALLLVLAMPALAGPTKKTSSKTKPPVVQPAAPAPAPVPVVEPAPPPPAPEVKPVKKDKPTMAVLDVEVTVPNEKLDATAFSEMLVTAVDGAGLFRVTSAKDLATLLGLERQRQLMGCSDDTGCMAELASALGTELVLVATVGKVADNYLVTARLIDGRTSRVAARGSVQAADANLLLSGIWNAAQQAIDGYGATLPPEQAEAFAKRTRQAPPEALVAERPTAVSFGVTVAGVAGYQVQALDRRHATIGVQLDGTMRLKRFDLAVGVLIGPNVGARVTATWALIDARFRLMAGLRVSTYPGLLLVGGGPAVVAEFGITPWLSASTVLGTDLFPTSSGLVVVLLGSAGVALHF